MTEYDSIDYLKLFKPDLLICFDLLLHKHTV